MRMNTVNGYNRLHTVNPLNSQSLTANHTNIISLFDIYAD